MIKSDPTIRNLLDPTADEFPPGVAEYLVALKFDAATVSRLEDLLDRNSLGTLDRTETQELDYLVQSNQLLGILKAKAALALKKRQG